MKHIVFLLIVCFSINGLYAQNKSTVGIDTPTAYTIEKGTYLATLLGYDGGGIELKTIIGLHNNIYLGAAFDIQSAIGKEDAKPNIPGVIARLKFTDGWKTFPISVAIGYDSFYLGKEGKVNNLNNELRKYI